MLTGFSFCDLSISIVMNLNGELNLHDNLLFRDDGTLFCVYISTESYSLDNFCNRGISILTGEWDFFG